MLKPLNSVVRTWRPTPEGPVDPLLAVMGAWSAIVGAEVAQNARPQRLERATLHVITRSSVWSQQLTFLQPHILRALRELPQTRDIEKLNFRIGRLHTRALVGREEPRALEPNPAALSKKCDLCGVRLWNAARCSPCVHAEYENRLRRLQRIMYETPWLSYEEISSQLGGLARKEYEDTRKRLLSRWWEILERVERTGRLRSDGFERRIADSYVLLQSGLPPDGISQAAIRNLLGNRLEKLLKPATESWNSVAPKARPE